MESGEGARRITDVIDFAFAPELEALSPHVERTVRLSAARANEQETALCGRPLQAVRPTRNSSSSILRFSRSSTSRFC